MVIVDDFEVDYVHSCITYLLNGGHKGKSTIFFVKKSGCSKSKSKVSKFLCSHERCGNTYFRLKESVCHCDEKSFQLYVMNSSENEFSYNV